MIYGYSLPWWKPRDILYSCVWKCVKVKVKKYFYLYGGNKSKWLPWDLTDPVSVDLLSSTEVIRKWNIALRLCGSVMAALTTDRQEFAQNLFFISSLTEHKRHLQTEITAWNSVLTHNWIEWISQKLYLFLTNDANIIIYPWPTYLTLAQYRHVIC